MTDFTFPVDEFLEHQEVDTFTFPLHASSIGRGNDVFRVKCRHLEITDRASLGFLPDKLQQKVWTQLRTTQKEIQSRQQQGMEPKDINEALANIDDQLRIADILCEYGWITPKVTRDPAKEDRAAGTLWIGRFKGADRIAYLIACNDADSEQARHFRVFRDEPGSDVAGSEAGEMDAEGASGRAGYSEHPVQFSAPVHGQ